MATGPGAARPTHTTERVCCAPSLVCVMHLRTLYIRQLTRACAAGRFDLHHAIKYHGGYLEVGQSLGRGSAWPRHTELLDARTLAAELRAFQREQGADAGCMPSARALVDADRQELLQARAPVRLGQWSEAAPPRSPLAASFKAVVNAAQRLQHN